MKDNIIIFFILFVGLNLFISFENDYQSTNTNNVVENNTNNLVENNVVENKIVENNENNTIDNLDIESRDYVLTNQLNIRDQNVVQNPLTAPEKRVGKHQYTTLKLYEKTRGDPDNYQLLGILYNDELNKTYQLFGRQTYPGSPQYEYYYRGRDAGGLDFKFPLATQNGKEIYDNDVLSLPTDNNNFTVKIYPNDLPRYNPIVE